MAAYPKAPSRPGIILILVILLGLSSCSASGTPGTASGAPDPGTPDATSGVPAPSTPAKPEPRLTPITYDPEVITHTGISEYEFKRAHIPGVQITCVKLEKKFKEGMKCQTGEKPQIYKEDQIKKRRIQWSHPGNAELINVTVPYTEKACTAACKTGLVCYYSMSHFDYICGKKKSKTYTDNQQVVTYIQGNHTDFKMMADGSVCWLGEEGKEYDPKEIDQMDIATAAWLKDREIFDPIEKALEYNCVRSCKFEYEKASFICANPKLVQPTLIFIIFLLFLGFLLH